MAFENLGVLTGMSFLRNETGSDTQRINTSSIVISNDLQLSLGGHSLDLLDGLALVPVEEVVDNDVGGKLLRKDGGGSEVPGNDDALTSRELLDLDFLDGESLELGGELLNSEGRKTSFLRGSAS
jgi:hypothetical protein